MNSKTLNKIFDQLFPILRSILGKGYRDSLSILSKYINFKLYYYPSGKKVLDWRVPKEWVINDAYISSNGKKMLDLKDNNLHVLNYSAPVNKIVNRKELDRYLYSIKKYPNLIPYTTSYYKKKIGFNIQEKKRKLLKSNIYKIFIDSKFIDGNVINGVATLKGSSSKIILITSYLCHPSMANNELSGPLALVSLYNKIKRWKKRKYTYLFLVNPETIGAICFLSSHMTLLKKKLDSGIVLNCLGGPRNKLTYKKSRLGNSSLDKIFSNLHNQKKVFLKEFDPTEGSDENIYCSAEGNFPVGQISRTPYKSYYQYHTSGDNKNFMDISQLNKSINELYEVLKLNENLSPLHRYIPYGELQLGKRGLYPNINSYDTRHDSSDQILKNRKSLNILLYLLSYADGNNNLLDISNKSNFSIPDLKRILKLAKKYKLIK